MSATNTPSILRALIEALGEDVGKTLTSLAEALEQELRESAASEKPQEGCGAECGCRKNNPAPGPRADAEEQETREAEYRAAVRDFAGAMGTRAAIQRARAVTGLPPVLLFSGEEKLDAFLKEVHALTAQGFTPAGNLLGNYRFITQ